MTNNVYTITIEESQRLSETNGDFVDILQSGCFIYIENSYVFNLPKYVYEPEAGIYELTEYARNNLSECALAFNDRLIYKYSGSSTRGDAKKRSSVERKQVKEYNSANQDSKLHEILQEVKDAIKIIEKLPRSFGDAIVSLMNWRKITNEKLAEKTLMSAKTIQRMRNNPNPDREPGKVVAVCVGLQLFPRISQELLNIAGIVLRNTETDNLYSVIIGRFYKSTIQECNELMLAANLPPLTTGDE